MSTKIVVPISAAQCRGARALLDMNQTQLASSAVLGLSTIVDFERGRRQVSDEAVVAIRKALEAKGVEFIDENGGGPGVRLKKIRSNK
jgi:predicted transcriptional regulator